MSSPTALGADVELDVHLRLALPLIDGGRVRILEREILHILGEDADLGELVGAHEILVARAVRAFFFGHFC